jgi:hypothetical protein
LRLAPKNILVLFLICVGSYLGAGYSLDYFDGLTFNDPTFLFFDLNPRVDRLIYWTLADSGINFGFFLLAYLIEIKYYPGQKISFLFKGFQAYFLAEFIMVFITQFLLAGKSQNHLFLFVAFIIFAYRIMKKNAPKIQTKN